MVISAHQTNVITHQYLFPSTTGHLWDEDITHFNLSPEDERVSISNGSQWLLDD